MCGQPYYGYVVAVGFLVFYQQQCALRRLARVDTHAMHECVTQVIDLFHESNLALFRASPPPPLTRLLLSSKKSSVKSLCIPVIGASQTPGGREAAVTLARIQACRGLKLLRNCLAWRDLLSPQSLIPVTLGELVSKRLIPALRGLMGGGVASGNGGSSTAAGGAAVEALALCERAVELLPLDWMERPDASATLASIRITARLFGDGSDVERGGTRKGKVAVERVVRLQVALGDEGAARGLAQKHGLKIA